MAWRFIGLFFKAFGRFFQAKKLLVTLVVLTQVDIIGLGRLYPISQN
jgi:hypothetical protein